MDIFKSSQIQIFVTSHNGNSDDEEALSSSDSDDNKLRGR